MVILLGIVSILLLVLALFLGNEHLKKFGFMRDFVSTSNLVVSYSYPGAKQLGSKPSMQNLVLRSEDKQPFCALVGFRLEIPILKWAGYDYYGFVQSNDEGVAVISTWLGNGPCEFQFVVSDDLDHRTIRVYTNPPLDQELEPDVVYPPHWYQRIGFYG